MSAPGDSFDIRRNWSRAHEPEDNGAPARQAEGCAAFADELGAYLDGELSGARMLAVSRHLAGCPTCTSQVENDRVLGHTLRAASPADLPPGILSGLAGSVVGRVRAESAQSWRGLFERASGDWHWAIVGIGALAATCVTTSILSLILAFGPRPQREDSLSAMITNLGSPAGLLFVYASPDGDYGNQNAVLLQIENGRPMATAMATALAVPASHRLVSEAELVDRLATAVTHEGRVVTLDAMNPEDRQRAEALFDELTRMSMRSTQPVRGRRSFKVYEVRLVTSTGVTAKGV